MEEMNHTRGPWRFRELSGDDGLGYIEADGRDIMHAGVSDLSAAENRANGLLTAAAPDLLEALETAMQWIKAWDVAFLFDDEWADDEAKIHAAIAKATEPEAL